MMILEEGMKATIDCLEGSKFAKNVNGTCRRAIANEEE